MQIANTANYKKTARAETEWWKWCCGWVKKQEWEDDRCRFWLLPRQETIITLQGLGLQNRLNSRNYDLPMKGSDCDQNMHGNLITFDYYNKWRSGWIIFGCRTLMWQTQSAPTFIQPHSLNRVPRLSLKFTHHLFHSIAKIKSLSTNTPTSLDAYSSIHRLSEAGPNSICLNNVFFCRSMQAVCFNTGWEWINNGDYKDISGD